MAFGFLPKGKYSCTGLSEFHAFSLLQGHVLAEHNLAVLHCFNALRQMAITRSEVHSSPIITAYDAFDVGDPSSMKHPMSTKT